MPQLELGDATVDERLLGKAKHRRFSDQWPHIARFLRAPDSTGWVDDKFSRWSQHAEELSPAERAAAYEEWADFYQWRLTQRAAELARDPGKRHLVEEWTDNMAYCCRRSAAWARGEDPGEWVPQSQRRPDLHAESLAIVAEMTAGTR
jgi:hypothetical protein